MKRKLILGLTAVLALAALYPVARIGLYRQRDDSQRIESKRGYLEVVAARAGEARTKPNVVVILFDDLGYGDVGAYGGRTIRTPSIDRLAAEGALFRNAYAPSPYCSGSRAGMMTGRYPIRAGLDHVLQPAWSLKDLLLRLRGMNRRLPAEEITLADVLSAAGYATAVVGKWHLGEVEPSLPNDLGFDTFYGLLHSNDQGEPAVWRNTEIVKQHPIDQTALTRRYTDEAIRFIEANRDRPFFLYMPHTYPHVPLHAAAGRRGSSEAGLYGDVVEELDASVGAVVDALQRTEVAPNTLLVVSSDNGPWFQGSPGGIRGRKFDVFEGGMRVPFIAAWPGRIPEGMVIDEPVVSIDLLPTVLEATGIPGPKDRIIDGQSLFALLDGAGPTEPRPVFFHQLSVLKAVRLGRFKYHDRHGVFRGNPMDWSWGPMETKGPWLFDLQRDPDESYDVSDRHPQVAERLRRILEERRRELEANPRGWL